MATNTKIAWTDATWNPLRGCSPVSAGCDHCYAARMASRFSKLGQPFEGLADTGKAGPRWTGKIKIVEGDLGLPLRWRKPRRIFVNSMGDLFHDAVSDQFITDVFGIMALAHWHTFQILTKRPERMRAYLTAGDHGIIHQFRAIQRGGGIGPKEMFAALDIKRRDNVGWPWPLPNAWLGVSVENQQTADERIPLLLQTPSAVRFASYEPALGPVNFFACGGLASILSAMKYEHDTGRASAELLDWIIAGGESGPNARPAQPAWIRSTRDQCRAAYVPFFFKSWGEFCKPAQMQPDTHRDWQDKHGLQARWREDDPQFWRVGNKAAGRLLDGAEWNEYPNGDIIGGKSNDKVD